MATQAEALEVLKSGKNVFLTGQPGSGKSYTVNQFIAHLREEGIPYAVTASTGIAATHIGGTTIHSWSGIGVKQKHQIDEEYCWRLNEFQVMKVQGTRVLIIDEVSMLHADVIDMVHFVCSTLRDEPLTTGWRPFGGLQVVMVGDFYQLPPVTKDKQMLFAFESEQWNKAEFEICYLTEQHRQSDSTFLNILTSMRNGNTTGEQRQILRDTAKRQIIPETKLFTHNADVDRMNDDELAKLEGDAHVYKAKTWGVAPFLEERLIKDCLSPEILTLKEGARVMFTCNNFDPETGAGYVNGTLGTVIGFMPKDEYTPFDLRGLPIVETKDGREIIPQRVQWRIEENEKVKATFEQVPLRLAWAITVHKSQGMSLDEASMDLSKCFTPGQGYVAISRVRSLEGLHITGMNSSAFEMHPRVVAMDKIFKGKSV